MVSYVYFQPCQAVVQISSAVRQGDVFVKTGTVMENMTAQITQMNMDASVSKEFTLKYS